VNISFAWSPDGKKITFERLGKIYIMNSDSNDITEVT